MAKLTHIDDLERERAAQEDEREMQAAQEALRKREAAQAARAAEAAAQREASAARAQAARARAAEAQAAEAQAAQTAQREEGPGLDGIEQAARAAQERTADEEADFHGISSNERMSGMQIALIVLAVVVFAAAILYFINSWVPFV